jgi:hypothetical protein
VCTVIVEGGCGCGGGVSRYLFFLDKHDNFASHVTFAGKIKVTNFEKSYQF